MKTLEGFQSRAQCLIRNDHLCPSVFPFENTFNQIWKSPPNSLFHIVLYKLTHMFFLLSSAQFSIFHEL